MSSHNGGQNSDEPYDEHAADSFVPFKKGSIPLKKLEEALATAPHETSEPLSSYEYAKKVGIYRDFGGETPPWLFLVPGVWGSFISYLRGFCKYKLHPDYPLEFHCRSMVAGSKCQYIKDLLSFIVHENGILAIEVLAHCKMNPSINLTGSGINTYSMHFLEEHARVGIELDDMYDAAQYRNDCISWQVLFIL